MKKHLALPLLSLTLGLVAGAITPKTFSEAKDEDEGAIYIGEVSKEKGPIFYPADYSLDIKDEPQYSTQNTKTFSLMNFSKAPNQYRGESVKVAVIDSGINYNHEDFGDIEAVSGTIDSTSGSWVYYKYGLGYESKLNDTHGHGTNVASVIASQINGLGCAGIAPNVDLYVFKVTNSSNGYEWTAINEALQYCVDNKIDVVNMSFQAYENAVSYNGSSMVASTDCSSILSSKINACYNAGITLVAAAGNYNTNEPSYPASNNHVISVGSLADGSTTQKAGFSNTYGIDLVAPGYVQVADKGSTNAYKTTSGTSFSAPIVTAAIALYKQKHPNASPSEIENALYNSCDEISGNPAWAGNGRLNIDRFLGLDENSPQSISIISPSSDTLELQVGETYQLQYSVEPNTFTGDVEFTTYETGAISVSSSGLITALAEGEDTVSINPVGFANINDEIDVTVVPKASTVVETLSDSKTVSFSGSKEGTWEISPQTTYCGLYYSGKNSSATITNKSINEFSNFATSTESSLTVYVDGICNSGTNSVKVSTIDSSGAVIETANTLTGKLGSGSNSSNAKSAGPFTFTPSTAVSGLQIVIGAKCCVTKVSYSYSYTKEVTGGGTTKTLSSISITNQKASFTVGETWSFGGTVTANYSDNSHADVTEHVTFSGNSTSTTGTKTVTVSYTEGGVTKTATYNITVSAQAVTNYTVTFDSNGGSGTMTSKTTNGSSYVTPTCSFTKEGYTFDKWALNSTTGNKYAAGTTINNISSNITLYATWTQNSSTGGEGVQMPSDYYNTITDDLTGETLLSKLRQLNLSKRTSTVGYSNMGTSPSGSFKYTDYDPTTVKYDANGQPYGTAILSFYSGKSCTSWNREHVWPNSRGGGSGGAAGDPHPDADIFMPRPTITEENSDRGNSKYVEGIVSTTAGWDPVTAFEKTLGVYPGIRGECARIIFYCMTVNSNLVLDDTATGGTIGVTMGKLSDLLRWNLENPVNDREIRRQSGGQYLQNNRNAFVDDPGYACRIWGNYNESTRQICSQTPVEDKNLVELEATGSPTKTTYSADESFDPTGLTIIAKYDDGNTEDVTSKVQWSQLVSGESEVTGTYTYKTTHKSVIISGLTITASKVSYFDVIKSGTLQKGYSSVGTYSSSSGYGSLYGTNYLTSGYVDLEGGSKIKVTCDIGTYGGYKTDGSQNLTIGLYDADGELISDTATFGPSKTNTKQGNDIVTCTLTLDSGKQSGFIRIIPNSSSTSGSFARLYNLNLEYTPYQEVGPQVKTITLSTNSLSFDLYNDVTPKTLNATVEADEGADTTVIWLSSDEDVATVENGVVTPHNEGNVIITAKSKLNPEIKDTCTVSVTDSSPKPVTGITLNKTSLQLVIDSKFTLVCTITPSNATNQNVTWSSSDEDVATVSDGVVTSKAVGSVTITVTTVDGGFTATCTITVSATPEITYKLEADNEVPYMSGTNHSASVGVKLYEYTNGVKGDSVKTGTANVDTSVLGEQDISIVYNSVTYYGKAKVTNYGADVGESSQAEPTIQNKSASFTIGSSTISSWNMPTGWSATANGTTGYDSGRGIQLQKNASITFTLPTYQNITSISIDVARSSNGKGTFSILVGSNTEKTISSFETTSRTETVTFSTPKSGIINIQGSAPTSSLYIKKIVVNYQEITEGQTITHNATPVQQAEAWADYFVRLTGGGEFDGPCKLGTPEAKKAALQQVWGELKSEYVYMVEGSKTAFCSTDATETIAEAVQHYRYIVNTYGLEDFAEVPQVSSSNKLIPISDSEPFIIGVIAMVGLAAIGGYFVFRRRREE